MKQQKTRVCIRSYYDFNSYPSSDENDEINIESKNEINIESIRYCF